MNKILRVILFAAALSYVATGKLNAQELNNGLSFLNFKLDPSIKMSASAMAAAYSMYTESGNDDLAKAKSDLKAKRMYFKSLKASNRASTDFSKSFKTITNAEWQINKEAIVATFLENEIRHYVVYDKKGHWVRNMAYLFPNRIPESLRRDIGRSYPGYTINMALELTQSDVNMHIVYLENDSIIKHVSYYNNEIVELEEYRKIK